MPYLTRNEPGPPLANNSPKSARLWRRASILFPSRLKATNQRRERPGKTRRPAHLPLCKLNERLDLHSETQILKHSPLISYTHYWHWRLSTPGTRALYLR